jgi:hypothetical protein
MQTVMNKKCNHSALNGMTNQKLQDANMPDRYTTHTFSTFFTLSMYRILYAFSLGCTCELPQTPTYQQG